VKFPFDNLIRAARVPIKYHANTQPTRGDYARAFGVTLQTIDRWRETGIPWQKADHLAVTWAGVHPGAIWPEWWDIA
jgi:hypothetical protein